MRVLRATCFAACTAILAVGLLFENSGVPVEAETGIAGDPEVENILHGVQCDSEGQKNWDQVHLLPYQELQQWAKENGARPMLQCSEENFENWTIPGGKLRDFRNFNGCDAGPAKNVIVSVPGRCFYTDTVLKVAAMKTVDFAGVYISSGRREDEEKEMVAFWKQYVYNIRHFQIVRNAKEPKDAAGLWVLRCTDDPPIGITQKTEVACLQKWGFRISFGLSEKFAMSGEFVVKSQARVAAQ